MNKSLLNPPGTLPPSFPSSRFPSPPDSRLVLLSSSFSNQQSWLSSSSFLWMEAGRRLLQDFSSLSAPFHLLPFVNLPSIVIIHRHSTRSQYEI
uniref:Uncharacterized protein n=1 Tax=Arundo donax TaxID=35708 RepID=A0A0A8Y4J7_ARUDO